MTCRELIEFLDDHLEGRLNPAARFAFDEHLANCRDCLEYLASYRETIRLGRAAFSTPEERVAAMPESLVRAVLAARSRS
jgi:anti-sigma factor RsiW